MTQSKGNDLRVSSSKPPVKWNHYPHFVLDILKELETHQRSQSQLEVLGCKGSQ